MKSITLPWHKSANQKSLSGKETITNDIFLNIFKCIKYISILQVYQIFYVDFRILRIWIHDKELPVFSLYPYKHNISILKCDFFAVSENSVSLKQCVSRIISSDMLSSPYQVQLIWPIYSNYAIIPITSINRFGTIKADLSIIHPSRATTSVPEKHAAVMLSVPSASGRGTRGHCSGRMFSFHWQPPWLVLLGGSERWESASHSNSPSFLSYSSPRARPAKDSRYKNNTNPSIGSGLRS